MEVGPNRIVGSTGKALERSEEIPPKRISSQRLNEINIKHTFNVSDITLSRYPPSVTSAETSGPPSPREGEIVNFGEVDKDLYRSSFPGSCNLDHLRSLKLKTLVTLVTTTFEPKVIQWLVSSNVQHYRIRIPAHKTSDDRIPMESVAMVMELLRDNTKRPLLFHCNKGKHRTGCMTACYRKLQGSDDVTAISEYHRYAAPKARAFDVAFISKVKPNIVLDAISNLKGPIEPICHHHYHASGYLRSLTAPEQDTAGAGSIDGEGSCAGDDDESATLQLHRVGARQPTIVPQAPLSPPFPSAMDLGFDPRQLAEALSKIENGRDRYALTPPQTPSEDLESDASSSVAEYS